MYLHGPLTTRPVDGTIPALVDLVDIVLRIYTPPKFNIAPQKLPSNRKVVFQPPFFRGYVKLRGCTIRFSALKHQNRPRIWSNHLPPLTPTATTPPTPHATVIATAAATAAAAVTPTATAAEAAAATPYVVCGGIIRGGKEDQKRAVALRFQG